MCWSVLVSPPQCWQDLWLWGWGLCSSQYLGCLNTGFLKLSAWFFLSMYLDTLGVPYIGLCLICSTTEKHS